jgi:hypothetical protein
MQALKSQGCGKPHAWTDCHPVALIWIPFLTRKGRKVVEDRFPVWVIRWAGSSDYTIRTNPQTWKDAPDWIGETFPGGNPYKPREFLLLAMRHKLLPRGCYGPIRSWLKRFYQEDLKV